MSEAITTGVFGTLIVAVLVYLVARIDRLDHDVSARLDDLSQRVARIEGRLDEREHTA